MRTVRRLQAFARTRQVESLLIPDLDGLPGSLESRIARWVFPFLAVWETALLGGAAAWSFWLHPWSGRGGAIGMLATVVGVVLPVLVWNYNLIIRRRGLPKGFTWQELEGNARTIRGL